MPRVSQGVGGGVMGLGESGSKNSGRGESNEAESLDLGVVLRLVGFVIMTTLGNPSSSRRTAGFPCEDAVDLRLLLRLLFLFGIFLIADGKGAGQCVIYTFNFSCN